MSQLKQNITNAINNKDRFGFYYNSDYKLVIMYPYEIKTNLNGIAYLVAGFSPCVNREQTYTFFTNMDNIDISSLYLVELDKIIEFDDYNENAYDKYSTCVGCRYGMPNQLAHYDEGGCME